MAEPLEIPQRLTDAIIFLRGEEDGRLWLSKLPSRIRRFAREWNLVPQGIADGGAMSCCVFCLDELGRECVLKIPVDVESGRREAVVLACWTESAASPGVWRTSRKTGVFLMERLRPGLTAWPQSTAKDSRQFMDLVERMQAAGSAVPRGIVSIVDVAAMRLDWAEERFEDPRYSAYATPVALARSVLERLDETTTDMHLLHGDLQAKNVLIGPGGAWYAIDPLAGVGDINAEPGLWCVVQSDDSTIESRVDELSSHPRLTRARLEAWAFIFAVAELRPYSEKTAARMAQFIDRVESRLEAEHLTLLPG
jgi:streptomycin 6-kinase